MCTKIDHHSHKVLSNKAKNTDQPTRRKEKCLIKFKSPYSVQNTLSLIGKVRNIFTIDASRYSKNVNDRRSPFKRAKEIWDDASHRILAT